MRLLTRNTLLLLAVTILVFVLGGLLFYFQLHTILDENTVEKLYNKKLSIETYIRQNAELPKPIDTKTLFRFTPIDSVQAMSMQEVAVYTPGENEVLPYKQMTFSLVLNQQVYACVLREPEFESDDLIETILNSFVAIALLLIVVFIGINYLVSKQSWRPFFENLQRLEKYDPSNKQPLTLSTSKVREFEQFKTVVEKMAAKISADFESLKSFTENASHELQTPLAVMKNQCELLLNDASLNEQQIAELLAMKQQINKLSRLNQSLLFLSKIENNQFTQQTPVDVAAMLTQKLEDTEELFKMKGIETEVALAPCTVVIHPVLAESIISNLLSNAIRHTPEKGHVKIVLNTECLSVANTAAKSIAFPERLFDRFYKENNGSESSGLGLALIHQIAQANRHRITYRAENVFHVFRYFF